MSNKVTVITDVYYDDAYIAESLPAEIFDLVRQGDTVILKPNWVLESHKERPNDWEYVITHPAVITAVLRRVLDRLDGTGKIIITDGPQTDASFGTLISRYPLGVWRHSAEERGVGLEVIDLRDYEWVMHNGNVVERNRLRGDPRGSTEVNIEGEKVSSGGIKNRGEGTMPLTTT